MYTCFIPAAAKKTFKRMLLTYTLLQCLKNTVADLGAPGVSYFDKNGLRPLHLVNSFLVVYEAHEYLGLTKNLRASFFTIPGLALKLREKAFQLLSTMM